VYPDLLSGFCLQDVGKGREQERKLWLDIFAQLAQTACKPMNNIDFCLFAYRDVGKGREQGCGSLEQSEQKSLSQNPGFGCNIRLVITIHNPVT